MGKPIYHYVFCFVNKQKSRNQKSRNPSRATPRTFSVTSLLPAAASDAAAVAIHGNEKGMAKMGRSGNWKLDDRKLSRRKFLSWRNENFRDVNFQWWTTENCPDVNRPSRTRRVVKMRKCCQKFILGIEVRYRINRIL